ncbi:MAG: hypothetical protein AM324_002580 [Candidatus Thorarchaeota archaeon SMTZ1-83]|nr:MAG: hypothetical protein AM324_03590 [Candidatus Thorarchaeota archaeon SMTZ1-83]
MLTEIGGTESLARTLDEAMKFLQNHAVTWHHWLLILSLLDRGGTSTKAEILSVYKKEGFSPYVIEQLLKTDLKDLGDALRIEGDLDNLTDETVIRLARDPTFMRFIKKQRKSALRNLKVSD